MRISQTGHIWQLLVHRIELPSDHPSDEKELQIFSSQDSGSQAAVAIQPVPVTQTGPFLTFAGFLFATLAANTSMC